MAKKKVVAKKPVKKAVAKKVVAKKKSTAKTIKVGSKVTYLTNGGGKELKEERYDAIVTSVGTDGELDLRINATGGVYAKNNVAKRKSKGKAHWDAK